MKKLTLLLLLAMMLSSCSQGGKYETVLIKYEGNPMSVSVGQNTILSVSGLSLKDGVTVFRNGSRSLSSGNGKGFVKTESDGCILVPDSNGTSSVLGADVGLHGNETVSVRQFDNIQSDFAITKEEYPSVTNGIVEEYYYVDFSAPGFSTLDRSKICVTSDGGVGGIRVVSPLCSDDSDLFHEFSSAEGFGIYAYEHFPGMSFRHVRVCNPVILTPDIPVKVEGERTVISVPLHSGESCRIKIALSSWDDAPFFAQGLYRALDENGANWSRILIPEFQEEEKTVYLYMGNVDRPFFFDLCG